MTTPSDRDPGRTELARQWARALRLTAYAPVSHVEIERLLRELLDSLFKAITVQEPSPNPGRAVGQRLVTAYFTGE